MSFLRIFHLAMQHMKATKICLALVFVAKCFAETNWVTSGTTSVCSGIWNFQATPKCVPPCVQPPFYQDHYAVLWTPFQGGWESTAYVGPPPSTLNTWNSANLKVFESGGHAVDVSQMVFTDGSIRYDSVYSWAGDVQRENSVDENTVLFNGDTATMASYGFYLTRLRAVQCNPEFTDPVCWTVIYDKRNTSTVYYKSLTDANVGSVWNEWTAKGYRLIDVSGFQLKNGTVVYTNIWDNVPGGWYYWIGSATFFQQKLNDMKNQGYYLNHVHVYTVNGQVVYMGLFQPVPYAGFQWSFIGGLNSAEFGKYWNCMASSQSPRFQLAEVASYFDLEYHVSH